MNYKSLNSYLLSLVILQTKHEEEALKGNLETIRNYLFVNLRVKCKQNNINITKQIDKIWNEFVELSDGVEVSEIAFALQLITTNQNKNKHKNLTKLALETAKEYRFSKDEQVVNAKALIYKFMNRR